MGDPGSAFCGPGTGGRPAVETTRLLARTARPAAGQTSRFSMWGDVTWEQFRALRSFDAGRGV
jgi:hypothetical protein